MYPLLVTGLISFLAGFGAALFVSPHFNATMPVRDTKLMSIMDMEMSMPHPMLETDPNQPIPTVSIEALPDAMDGYNIRIVTTHYRFAPEAINTEPRPNEGHAHLYVNGQKIARLYGNWFHLSAAFLSDGENVVEVTLNANDHSEWAQDGMHIMDRIMLIR